MDHAHKGTFPYHTLIFPPFSAHPNMIGPSTLFMMCESTMYFTWDLSSQLNNGAYCVQYGTLTKRDSLGDVYELPEG